MYITIAEARSTVVAVSPTQIGGIVTPFWVLGYGQGGVRLVSVL